MASLEEIENTLNLIRMIWREQPQLRLCQLLNNTARLYKWKDTGLFYISDKELREGLQQYLKDMLKIDLKQRGKSN
jgi:uncharacterized protein YihD (DUF1040 family)